MARQVSFSDGSYDKVWEIKTLGKARDVEARKLLEDAAKQVQPIMRRRRWRVKLLSEFSPPQSNLLGLNIDGGQEIQIRLRRPGNDLAFFDYEHVLGTMLHELVHIVVGPHNAQFYKLLDELNQECDELIAKGLSGTAAGFDCRGQRLGGITHNPHPVLPKRNVLAAAAEKRARVNQMLPSGPRRLGGDTSLMRRLPPAAAAAMAAERRLRDDVWCGASDGEPAGGSVVVDSGAAAVERTSALNGPRHDTKGKVAEGNRHSRSVGAQGPCRHEGLTRGHCRSVEGPQGSSQTKGSGPAGSSSHLGNRRDGQGVRNTVDQPIMIDDLDDSMIKQQGDGRRVRSADDVDLGQFDRKRMTERGRTKLEVDDHLREDLSKAKDGRWECAVCTLVNRPLALQCGACGVQRPAVDSSASYRSLHDLTWTCKFCTLENPTKAERCGACDTWRYSTGVPVAIRGPGGT